MKNRRTEPLQRGGARVLQQPAGRVCANELCATVLSVYNAAEFCSLHEPRTRRSGVRP